MNIDKNNILNLLEEKINVSLYPLKMGGEVNEKSLKELLFLSEEATRLFKHEALVPKKLLSEIYLASVGIKIENEFINSKLLSEVSSGMMNCFNLILSGESVDDKKEIGPRII
ncbi:hypothetical protein [Mangrovibacter plantisponsor]|uniref:Uncharacterized protein n=1 Tax=Mangrovibacter plantisponsor TaxID=451513 RepID=A0A317PI60_9ENTR|nr:hypothetical protein [Mangrovibacter plantisponsor]PWV99282.1 hypothetical protein DES37_1353 [Mangrovibacter plantisponsor]